MQNNSKKLLSLAITSILFTIIAVSFFPVDDFKADAQSANATKYKYEPFLTLTDSNFHEVPDMDNLNLTEFTVAAWFRTTQNNTEPGHIVNKGGMNTDEEGMNLNYGIWTNEEDGLAGGFETAAGEDFIIQSREKYNDGNWHYATLTFNGTTLFLFVDGKPIGNKLFIKETPDNTGNQPLRIGANSLNEDKFFTGQVDEIMLWNRALDMSEIENMYLENKFNPTGQVLSLNYGEYTNSEGKPT
jgi:Concanavalin A-like lectin/glucanases superfamily